MFLFVFLFTSFQVPPVKVNLSSVGWFKSFTDALTFPDDCLGLTQTADDEAWKRMAIFSAVPNAAHGTYRGRGHKMDKYTHQNQLHLK